MRLISIAETKTMLPLTGDAHDTVLTLIVDGVSELVEQHLNRQLKKQARTQRFSGGGRYCWLPAYPVDESAELTITEDGVVLTVEQDFAINKSSGQIEFLHVITKRVPLPLAITWTGGFAETVVGTSPNQETILSVPKNIKLATYMQSNYIFRRRDKLGLDTVELGTMGTVALQGLVELVPEVRKILAAERRLPSSL